MMRNSRVKRMSAPAKLATGVGGAVGVALLAAACSSAGSSSSTPAASSSAPASASAPSSAASGGASASGATVIKTASAAGSTFLTDGSGRAVYLWAKDTSGMSVCTGACAGAWPPVTTTSTATASGSAKASDLGTITRTDGSKQVTYDGHALYYFVGDSGPGMATGQGSDNFGAKWWLVNPAGSDVTGSVSSFTASTSTGSGGSAPAAPAPAASSKSAGGGWS